MTLLASLMVAAALMLPAAGDRPGDPEAIRRAIYGVNDEIGLVTACGPISVLAVCDLRGRPISLSQAIEDCKWTPETPPTLNQVAEVLERRCGVRHAIRRIATESRAEFLARVPTGTLLVLRPVNGTLQHLVVVLQSDGDGGVLVFDYPGGIHLMSSDVVRERWEGVVVIQSGDGAGFSFLWSGVAVSCVGGAWLARGRKLRRMARTVCAAALLAVLFAPWSITQASVGDGPPAKAAFPTQTYARGRVPENITIERTVELRNPTQAPLQLKRPVESCGACIHVVEDLAGRILAPGEALAIHIQLRTTGKRGKFSPWVVFLSESQGIPLLKVEYNAQVAAFWGSDDVINLGIVEAGALAEYSFAVYTDSLAGEPEVSCVGVTGMPDAHVELTQVKSKVGDGPVALARGQFRWRAPSQAGAINGRIELLAGGTSGMSLTIAVQAIVVLPSLDTNGRILLGTWCVTRDSTREFVLPPKAASRLQATVPGTVIQTGAPEVDVLGAMESDGRLRIQLCWRGEFPKHFQILEGTLRTRRGDQEVAEIPYMICCYPQEE